MDRRLFQGLGLIYIAIWAFGLSQFFKIKIDMYFLILIACYFALTAILSPTKGRLEMNGSYLLIVFCLIMLLNIIKALIFKLV